MNKKLPVTEFIKQHLEKIGYRNEQPTTYMDAALGSLYKAATHAGYNIDSSFLEVVNEIF